MSGTEGDDISDGFVRENRQHIRTLVEALMAMEPRPDRETVDEAFRAAHSLKANCEMAGLDAAAAVAHAVEDVLAAVRSGSTDLDETTADEAMAGVEMIERVVDGNGSPTGTEIDARVGALRRRLDGVNAEDESDPGAGDGRAGDERANGGDATAEPTGEAAAPDLDDLGLDEEAREAMMAASDYDDLDTLVAEMDDDAAEFADLEGAGSFDEIEDGADGGDDGGATSDGEGAGSSVEDGTTGEDDPLDEPVLVPTEAGEQPEPDTADDDDRDGEGTADDDRDPDVAPLTARAPAAAREAFGPVEGVAVPGAGRVADAATTIDATDDDRFDAVPTPETEAETEARARAALDGVRSLATEGRRLATALDDLGVEDERVTDALASLRAATGTLGGAAAAEFRRLDAVVADLERAVEIAARRVDTPVEFEADAAPLAVDRAVAGRLADPLIHCVRNAVDHGIESPAERGAAGKPEAGTVAVRARRESDRLVVSVTDDGRGVDADAVREAAIEAGNAGAAEMTDDEVLDLLFEAGLSTADADSDLSGRGVGMDVVGRTMADLDGEVAVESTPGEGTTVRLAVPVGTVVERVLLVAVGAETYAVPAGAVEEVVPATEATVRDGTIRVQAGTERDAMGDATAFGTVREHPVVDLGAALDTPATAGQDGGREATPDESAYLLVVGDDRTDGGAADDRPALRCDGVLAEHEAPVTPLRGVAAAPAVDGTVVCDAGRVVPTLDPGAFVGER